MIKNLTSTTLVKAETTKLTFDVAQPGPSAAGRFPSSRRLWRRAVCTIVVLLLVTLCAQIGSAQTVLLNGTNAAGTLVVNTTNAYTFIANAGDNVVLRLGSSGFEGNLNLYGPNGALLKTAGGNSTDWALAYTATNSGTFGVLVSSYYLGGAALTCCIWLGFPMVLLSPAVIWVEA